MAIEVTMVFGSKSVRYATAYGGMPGGWPGAVRIRWGAGWRKHGITLRVPMPEFEAAIGPGSCAVISRRRNFCGWCYVVVEITKRDGQTFEFKESAKGFPSEEMLAKLALST
jgi:hypothetical protein